MAGPQLTEPAPERRAPDSEPDERRRPLFSPGFLLALLFALLCILAGAAIGFGGPFHLASAPAAVRF